MSVHTLASHRVAVLLDVVLARHLQLLQPLALARARVLHRPDPVAGLERAGAHRLRPALPEEARHGRLVGEVVAADVAEVGELQRHLNKGVGRGSALFDQTLAELVMDHDVQVNVVQKLFGYSVAVPNDGLNLEKFGL